MINYLTYFFDPAHLFALRPPALHQRAITILVILFGVFILAGIISSFNTRRVDRLKAKGLKRITHFGLTVGLLGYLYLFFAWQRAALLGARFWLVGLALVTAIWLIFIIRFLVLEVPAKRKAIDQRRRFEQYLP